MARELTRKKLKKDEFVEAAFNVEQWVEENWRKLLTWVGAAVGLVLVVLAVLWWNENRREEANRSLAEGLEKFRAAATQPGASFDDALPALEKSQRAGGAVGWLGGYYRAAALIRAGSPDEGARLLGDLVGSAPNSELEQAARALAAEAAVKSGRVDDAIADLRALADAGGPYGPLALLQLGNLLAEQGKTAEAADAYRSLVESHPQDALAQEAQQALESAQN